MKTYPMPDGSWRWLIISGKDVIRSGVASDSDTAMNEGSSVWMELFGEKYAQNVNTAITGIDDMFGNPVCYGDALKWIRDESVDWEISFTVGEFVKIVPYGTQKTNNPSEQALLVLDFATEVIDLEYDAKTAGADSGELLQLFQTDERDWVFMPYEWAVNHGFDIDKYDKVYESNSDKDLSLSGSIDLIDISEGGRPVGQSDILRIGDRFWYIEDDGAIELEGTAE